MRGLLFLNNPPLKNYYSILGVPTNANHADIRRAYRQLAVQYHPDKNPSPQAEAFFKEVVEAYDVLGDPSKRFTYDQRMANPFSDVIVEDRPRHRDPAYRRRGPAARPQGPQYSETYLFIKQYQPYFIWVAYFGLAFIVIFFFDYVLPYRKTLENFTEVVVVKRRSSVAYFNGFTVSGKKVKFYELDVPIYTGSETIVAYTPLLRAPIWAETPDHSFRYNLGHMYHKFIFIPIIILLSSSLAILFRKKIEFCFNCTFVVGVFLIIFWVFV